MWHIVIFCKINHYPTFRLVVLISYQHLMDLSNDLSFKIQHNLLDDLILLLLTLFSRHTAPHQIISQQNKIDQTLIVIQISYWRGIKLPSGKIIKTVMDRQDLLRLGNFCYRPWNDSIGEFDIQQLWSVCIVWVSSLHQMGLVVWLVIWVSDDQWRYWSKCTNVTLSYTYNTLVTLTAF